MVSVNAEQAAHLETYAQLTRVLETRDRLRDAAAERDKLVWMLFAMVGNLQAKVEVLTEERDRLAVTASEGAAQAEGKLRQAVDNQARMQERLDRALANQREAEELSARLQGCIDEMTEELGRRRTGTGGLPGLNPTEPSRTSVEPEQEDIDDVLLRIDSLIEADTGTLDDITDEITQYPQDRRAVRDKPVTSTDTPDNTWAHQIAQAEAAAAAGDHASARDLYATLVSEVTRVLGPDHPDTLTFRHYHADQTAYAGDHAGARDLYAPLITDRA
ncbi:hypothetical protein ACH4FZ_36260, partial [Streptomyces goshikiensis]